MPRTRFATSDWAIADSESLQRESRRDLVNPGLAVSPPRNLTNSIEEEDLAWYDWRAVESNTVVVVVNYRISLNFESRVVPWPRAAGLITKYSHRGCAHRWTRLVKSNELGCYERYFIRARSRHTGICREIVRSQEITTSSNLWRLFSRGHRLAATPICITILHHSAAVILHTSRTRLYTMSFRCDERRDWMSLLWNSHTRTYICIKINYIN